MRFAEKNHKLVYAFLQEQRYDPGEYYDLAVMGYLRAVERYCSHAYLRRFSFSTVAYRAMQQSIVSWKRGESRRRQAEEAYCALCGRRETVCDTELSEAFFFSELQNAEHRSRLRLRCCVCMGTALRRSPRGTSSTRGVCAEFSKVCIPPICGSMGTGRRRKMKDQHTRMLHGRLLRPLRVGSSALIDHEGQFILTSLVTSIQVQNEQEAKFETLNTHYHVKFSPLQAAVAASILMAVAA